MRSFEIASDPKDQFDFEELIRSTKSCKAVIRKKALKEFCPCHVKKNIDEIWDRIFEMITDSDPNVRDQVVHSLCDGAPREREAQVIEVCDHLIRLHILFCTY